MNWGREGADSDLLQLTQAPEAVHIAKRTMISVKFLYLPDMNDQSSFGDILSAALAN